MSRSRVAAAALVVFVACSQGAHDVVDCDPSWGDPLAQTCEAACERRPASFGGSGSDQPCDAEAVDGSAVHCDRTFADDGTRGCCLGAPTDLHVDIAFYVCR